MSEKLILSYDAGTTFLKTSLVDTKMNIIRTELDNYPIYFPKRDYVEQYSLDLWNMIVKTRNKLLREEKVFKPDSENVSFMIIFSLSSKSFTRATKSVRICVKKPK